MFTVVGAVFVFLFFVVKGFMFRGPVVVHPPKVVVHPHNGSRTPPLIG